MALPTNTFLILQFLLPVGATSHLTVLGGADVRIGDYDETAIGVPQPTEQEIIDAGNDLTIINGQTFSQWQARNGGDPVLTAKRLGKELIEGSTPEGLLQRAVLRALINAIQAGQLKEGTSVTRQQLINAVKAQIDAE